jgi:hypothetical protein
MALSIGSSAAVSQEASPSTAEATGLREPDVDRTDAPTRLKRMPTLANVRPGDTVYDLGSGDDRIPITAAKEYGARGVGIDIDPKRIAESNSNAKLAGVTGKVAFRNEDLLLADFREATVVTLFLSSELNVRLKPKLLSELRPGTRVVSYWHDMPGWAPRQVIPAGDAYLYFWIIPKR